MLRKHVCVNGVEIRGDWKNCARCWINGKCEHKFISVGGTCEMCKVTACEYCNSLCHGFRKSLHKRWRCNGAPDQSITYAGGNPLFIELLDKTLNIRVYEPSSNHCNSWSISRRKNGSWRWNVIDPDKYSKLDLRFNVRIDYFLQQSYEAYWNLWYKPPMNSGYQEAKDHWDKVS